MEIKDIFTKARYFDTAARREKLQSPELIQKTKAVRHPKRGSRIAYCKNDAGSGTTIVCYLDKDGTGDEITVHCSISQGGSDLNEASPLLKGGTGTPPTGGDWMLVEKVWDGTNNYWRCSNCIFQPVLQPCVCVEP